MPEKMCKKKHLTSFQLIILGFAGVILLGSILLMLPVSSLDKVPTPFHEALFTATSAVCVTGLVVKDSGSYWSVFGQTVILALIQIGGLGVVTVAAANRRSPAGRFFRSQAKKKTAGKIIRHTVVIRIILLCMR